MELNYIALYAVTGAILVILPTIIEILRNIYFDVFKIVECVFIDTGRTKLVRNYRNKKTFKVKGTDREYVCSEISIKGKRVFYYSECAEPVKFSLDSLDASKTKFYIDSNEYYVKMNTNIFERFNISREADQIKLVFYGMIIVVILCFLIAYKIGAFSFGA